MSRPNNSTCAQDNLSSCRERVINNNVGLKPTLAMLFALLAFVGTILYIGFQNSANAAPEQVNFNGVTLRDGAKVYANGGQSLTAINSGANLVADTSSTTSVKGDAIASSLTSYTSSTYGDDTLFKTNTASNAKSLSEAQLNSFSSYLPTVNSDYWLSNTGARGSITWQSYATSANKLSDNTLKATGKIDGYEYDDTTVVKGTYAYNRDIMMSDYVTTAGGIWGLSNTQTQDFTMCYMSDQWFQNGTVVYNNPECLSSGVDSEGNIYKSSTVQNLVSGSGRKAFAYVTTGNKVVQLQVGQRISAGTVLAFGFMKVHNEIKDPTGFLIPNKYYGTGAWASASYIGFIKTTKDLTVTSKSNEIQALYGVTKYYSVPTTISGQNIASATKAVRPVYDLTNGNIAFSRARTSGTTLTTTNKFGNLPNTIVANSSTSKLVVKSSDTTITSAISASSLSTDITANGHASLTFSNGVIKVPFGSKTLTLNSSAFTTANANYISAIVNASDSKKYALLGRTGSNLTIDLTSILNVNQIGSKADVSFYAEQANASQTSDAVSATPVSLQIEVAEGAEQTIVYANGGGTGNLPANVNVAAGKSYSFASGLGLIKDGAAFSRWQVTYTPYGETTQTTQMFRGGEPIVVPDTTNGTITATALYAGVNVAKSTDSVETVITVTWDTNAPDGTTATFAGDGTFNVARTQRYDKIKLQGGSVAVPSAPVLSVTTKVFDGWYTDPVNGTKVSGATVDPIVNTTYYAHWLDGYKVTYVVTGGTGAAQTGKWSDGTTTDVEELVLSGASTKGPSKGTPVADNSLYMFYGWFPQPNGGGTELKTGTSFATLGGSKTVYAYYGLVNTFLAPATSTTTANPHNISGTKYSIAQVKAAADSIKSGTNPDPTVYNATNDSYHLYTLLKDSSGNYLDESLTDSWAEFRIIGVGSHDGDGSGLTFQMVHGMPSSTGWAYDSTGKTGSSLNWANSTLRPLLQSGGSIYNQFDTQLTSRIKSVAKKYNTTAGTKPTSSTILTTTDAFTILSYTEYQKSVNTVYWSTGQGGSTYAFWNQYTIANDSLQSLNPLQKLGYTRSNAQIKGTNGGLVWQRSVSPSNSAYVLFASYLGLLNSYSGDYRTFLEGVALSFSL